MEQSTATVPPVTAPLISTKSERLVSLDAFRGLTIAGMILVNNPGNSSAYAPLDHAPWDGWTPTDFIFPFFLFIVGVAMTFSFDKRLARGVTRRHLLGQVFCRSCIIYLLGLILSGFPNLRLITPYILTIVGFNFIFADPPAPREQLGWVLVAIAVLWFSVDFRYFNGPTRRSGFEYIFPLRPDGKGTPIRLVGVLPRIAFCYFCAALIMSRTGAFGRLACALFLINFYWVIMKFVNAPVGYMIGNGVTGITVDAPAGAPFPGRLNDWIDVKLLGRHLYSHRPDPEGLLSTLPAIATTLLGALTGMFLQLPRFDRRAKAVMMFAAGNALFIAGACMDCYFPINKKIWTTSYVVFMAGWALMLFGACYYLIDVKGYKKWALPFLVLGTNAITAFFGSGMMARLLSMIKWQSGTDAATHEPTMTTLGQVLHHGLDKVVTVPIHASLVWAICFVLVWVVLLTPLYRKGIFLKV